MMSLLATNTPPPSDEPWTHPTSEFGMTHQARTLFEVFERHLPDEFLAQLRQPDVVVAALFDASKELVVRVEAFRSFPVNHGSWVRVDMDWAFHHKLWFRVRPNAAPEAVGCAKYETFLSYLEDYRPEFQVDLTSPLFSLAIG